MLTRVYVAGEDAAHTQLVRGFLRAYNYPSARVQGDLSGLAPVTGRRGDGKAVAIGAAKRAVAEMLRQRHQNTLLVLVHDLDAEIPDALAERLLRTICEGAKRDADWILDRTLILLPEPEAEGWIAALFDVEYRSDRPGEKIALKKRAYEAGQAMGKTCLKGRSAELPEGIRAACAAVARHVDGLRKAT